MLDIPRLDGTFQVELPVGEVFVETLKNNDPASDTAKNASAPVLSACVTESRRKGMGPNTRP